MSKAKRASRKATRSIKKVNRVAERKTTKKAINSKVGKVVKNAKEKGAILLLKPYQGLMTKALKAKGVKAPSNLTDLAKTFFTEIVKKNHFEEHSHFGGSQNVVFDYENDYENIDVSRDSLDPVTIGAVVSAIIKFIKGQMDKKRNNEPMTPTQEKVAQIGQSIEREYNEVKRDGINYEIGDMITQYWYVPAGLFLLYFLSKK